MSIYRSIEGKEYILKLYDQNWAALGLKTESHFISTRYGNTHVMITGPIGALPIIVFHGGNMISPISFAWIQQLTSQYRFYAPDTIGHPGYSDETRLKPGTFQFGEWAADVIDGLGLENPICIGCSYGAGILLNLAAFAPQKVGKVILIVPSGFAPPPLLTLIFRIGFAKLMYQITHSRFWLLRSLFAIDSDPSENLIEITGAVYQHVRLETEMPRRIHVEDLKDFQEPTLVLTAEEDILFPPESVLWRACMVIPNLVAAEVIKGSTHFIPPHLWDFLCKRINKFILEGK